MTRTITVPFEDVGKTVHDLLEDYGEVNAVRLEDDGMYKVTWEDDENDVQGLRDPAHGDPV